jgi:glucose/arabinose dehydrogenase
MAASRGGPVESISMPLFRLLLLLTFPLPGVAAADAVQHESAVARFVLQPVVTGLLTPSGMAFLPDGRALVCDRSAATLYVLDVAGRRLTPVQDLPAVLALEDSGLHDVILHPDYASNGWIYLSYSEGEPNYSTTVVDRARLAGDHLVDRARILTADAYTEDRYHYGGRMAFHDGYLFVSVGDRHHQDRAQDLDNHVGKILRIRDDGTVPADNPFAADHAKHAEIWTLGHRNPQGLVVEPATGALWSHEHGPRGGDELNPVRRGANYGWPVISWGFEYDGGPIGKGIVSQDGMEQPVWVWSKSIAPSDMIFHSGRAFPGWKGSLFIGAMGGTHLNRLVIQDGRVVLEERLLLPIAGRVRLVEEGPDGTIYIGSDGGGIARLVPVPR